jgi:hypothetical protein
MTDTNKATGSLTDRLTHRIRELVPAWRALDQITFEFLPGGYSNENYRFAIGEARYVLRLPSRVRPFVDRAEEFAFYQNRKSSVLTADLIAFDVGSGAMISRFEPGDLLADAPPSEPDLISYLQSLHAGLPASGRTYDPLKLSRQFLSVGGAPDFISSLAGRAWKPELVAPSHNDLNPWNVIVAGVDRWVTLDWEWFGDNDPLFDLVTLHQGLAMADDRLPVIAEGWQKGPVAPARLEQCLAAFWLREFAWAWAERHHGNEREEIQIQIDTAMAKLKALSD